MSNQDVSKKTIMVLLILVILTSVIGTWVVLDATSDLSVRKVEPSNERPVDTDYQKTQQPPKTTAKVSFEVTEEETQ